MIRLTSSTVFERSPGWSPWESHPVDDRRNVASVPCGGVIAAATSAGLGVALVKALLTCDNSRGNVPENLSGPGAVRPARDRGQHLVRGADSGSR